MAAYHRTFLSKMRTLICLEELPNTKHTTLHRGKRPFGNIRVTCRQLQHRLSRCPNTQCPYKRRLTNHLNFFPQTITLSAPNTLHPTLTAFTNILMGWTGGKKRSSQKIIGPLCQVKECKAMIGLDDRRTLDIIDYSALSATLILRASDMNEQYFDALCIASDVRFSILNIAFTTYSSFCEPNDLTTAGRYDTVRHVRAQQKFEISHIAFSSTCFIFYLEWISLSLGIIWRLYYLSSHFPIITIT